MSNKNKLFFLALFLSANFFLSAVDILSWNLDQWIDQCNGLQTNRIDDGCRKIESITIADSAFGSDQEIAWKSFQYILDKSIKLMVDQLRKAPWFGEKPEYIANKSLKVNTKTVFPFAPFTARLKLEPGDVVIFHGDFHGDCHSFMNELKKLKVDGYLDDDFTIIKPNVRMVFLGDYVDRGLHGAEVIYTILRLKLANPDSVFMVRGNHEELAMNQVPSMGFAHEAGVKFGGADDSRARSIAALYEIMPVVLYVGCGRNYLQCCHGGMEPGYNPSKLLNSSKSFQLLGTLKRKTLRYRKRDGSFTGTPEFTPHALCSGNNQCIGFMWHDFIGNKLDTTIAVRPGRGLAFAKGAVEKLLSRQNKGKRSVRGVFRGHQHSGSRKSGAFNLMDGLIESRGVYKLWADDFETAIAPETRTISDGLVWTFNVAPDTSFGAGCGFNFDAYAMLTVEKDYDDWGLQVFNTETSVVPDSKYQFAGTLLELSAKDSLELETKESAIDLDARWEAIERRLSEIQSGYRSFKDRLGSICDADECDSELFFLEPSEHGGGGAAEKEATMAERSAAVKIQLGEVHDQLIHFMHTFDDQFEKSEDENACSLGGGGCASSRHQCADLDELLEVSESEQISQAEDFLKTIHDMYEYIECRFEEQGAF